MGTRPLVLVLMSLASCKESPLGGVDGGGGAGGTGGAGGGIDSGVGGTGGGESGRVPASHRAAPVECTERRPGVPHVRDGGVVPGQCQSDSDCEGLNAICYHQPGFADTYCVHDQCFTDDDCPPPSNGAAFVCVCNISGGRNACVRGTCRVDSDCGQGGYCQYSDYRCHSAYYCHTRAEIAAVGMGTGGAGGCVDDTDCDPRPNVCAYDELETPHWFCKPDCVATE